jgi:heme-degrading monooxygenase HmoA
MFAQVIRIQAPSGEIDQVRRLIANEYIPAIQARPGFLSAQLLEQIDDRDRAELIIYWDSQAAVEEFNRTGMLMGSDHSVAARIPGLRIQRQSYIVKVSFRQAEAITR